MSEVLVKNLQIGSRFYVEPEEGQKIPVEIIAPGEWGLVHGVAHFPCLRLDTQERVTVALNIYSDDTVEEIAHV